MIKTRLEQLTILLKERGFNPTEFIHRQPSANVQEKLQLRNWMKTVHLEWLEQRETSSHISKNIDNLDILGRPTKQKKRRNKTRKERRREKKNDKKEKKEKKKSKEEKRRNYEKEEKNRTKKRGAAKRRRNENNNWKEETRRRT